MKQPGNLSVNRSESRREPSQLFSKENKMDPRSHGFLLKATQVLGRSFFPLLAIVVIGGMLVWGPWISLVMTALAVAAALRFI